MSISGLLDGIPEKRPGDKLPAAQFNALVRAVRVALNLTGPHVIIDSSGIHITSPQPKVQRKKWDGRIIDWVEFGPNQWIYIVVEQRKDTPGYGGWVDKSDTKPREVACFNRPENDNSETGVQGTGIDVANLTGNFVHQPIPIWSIVEVTEIRLPAKAGEHGQKGTPASIEYWIDVMNGVDGACA